LYYHKSGYFLELNKIIEEKAGELKDCGLAFGIKFIDGLAFGIKFIEFLKGMKIETTGILYCISRR
jgi:hypothetical protein